MSNGDMWPEKTTNQDKEAIIRRALEKANVEQRKTAGIDELQKNPFTFKDYYPELDIEDFKLQAIYEMGVSAGIDSKKEGISNEQH